jgi:hypothetical protein
MTPTAEPTAAAKAGWIVAVPATLIQPDEEIVLAIKPSGFFILVVSAPALAMLAMLALASYLVDAGGLISLSTRTITATCMAGGLLRALIACLQWLSRTYVLTNRRVLRIMGVLRIDIFECGLARIQNTRLSLSVPERLFGMGTILFATAGTEQGQAAWLMIARPGEIHPIVVEYIRRAQRGTGTGTGSNGL